MACHIPPVLVKLKLIKNISNSPVAVKEDAKQHKFTINVIKKQKIVNNTLRRWYGRLL